MQQHLYKFLVLHRTLSIPGLGSFTIDDEPARMDVPSGLLFAPKPVIHFGETVLPVSEKMFYDFLSEEMDVDEATANKAFHDFADELKNNLQEHGLGLLQGVGRINRGSSDGGLYFTQESNLIELLPPVQLEENIRKIPGDAARIPAKKTVTETRKKPEPEPEPTPVEAETSEEIEEIEETEETVRDRWWIYAIILAAAGSMALLFYYQ